MKTILFAILLSVFPIFNNSNINHDYYFSSTTIEHDNHNKSLEITSTYYTDDLEKAVEEQYNIELQEQINAERQKRTAKESVRFDDKLLTKANEVIDQISYYLLMNEESMNEKTTPIQPNQFLALTNSLLAAQKLGKIAMGEITENINVNSTIKEADAFNRIMELLDTVKSERLNSDSESLH